METTNVSIEIGNRVRGFAAMHRATQADVGELLGLSRSSVGARFDGETSFKADELYILGDRWNVPVGMFYPAPGSVSAGRE
jgi:transcriptional regulator with XRE-family HTH domain